jgi:hypothetical protein
MSNDLIVDNVYQAVCRKFDSPPATVSSLSQVRKTPDNSPCVVCKQYGHWKNECPSRAPGSAYSRSYAPVKVQVQLLVTHRGIPLAIIRTTAVKRLVKLQVHPSVILRGTTLDTAQEITEVRVKVKVKATSASSPARTKIHLLFHFPMLM